MGFQTKSVRTRVQICQNHRAQQTPLSTEPHATLIAFTCHHRHNYWGLLDYGRPVQISNTGSSLGG